MSDDGAPGTPDSARGADPDGQDNLRVGDTFDDFPRLPAAAPALAVASPTQGLAGRRQTYRVRYSRSGKSGPRRAADVETLDIAGGLDLIPGGLPPGAYILSVEDLTAGRGVHWTRWPVAYRPGFGG